MKTYITNDMSIAAFLLMKGRTIVRAEKSSPGGRYVFEFNDDDQKCSSVALEFLSSKCYQYDSYLRMLRGMIRDQK